MNSNFTQHLQNLFDEYDGDPDAIFSALGIPSGSEDEEEENDVETNAFLRNRGAYIDL